MNGTDEIRGEQGFAPYPDTGDPGFGVYLHWPFCAAKCPYCDFNSHVRHKPVDQKRFIEAFRQEIAYTRGMSGPKTVTSIFIGGGTPSLMEPATVAAILESVADNWHVPDGIEVTLEANPSSVEAERFRGYRDAGVNRVSLGVQALDDRDLKFLGRLHNVEDALKAVRLAREIFPRLSFDLIYARPDQTVEAWEGELKEAISYAVDHLSLYQLTIEEGTPFHALHKAGKLVVPDGERSAELYEATQAITAAHGLPAYEVSNHARPGAHGRLRLNGTKIATVTERMPERWLELVEAKGAGHVDLEELASDEQADEFLLMGLRLAEGIDLVRWEELSGHSIDAAREAFLMEQGFIERLGNSRIRCTPAGMLILDAVVADLAT